MIYKNSLILASILALFSQTATAAKFQSHESITVAVRQFLKANITDYQEIKINIDPLDRRLKLPLCSTPLEVFSHTPHIAPGRLSIGIRCKGRKPWTIYNPAKIAVYKTVAIVKSPIQRGALIQRREITLVKRDISHFRQGYFSSLEQIINQQATRNLAAGLVLQQKHLQQPHIIKRGQKITISAKTAQFNIQMMGLALMDGIKGQRIQVKNEKSKRIIEATVIEPGLVAVSF